MISKTQLLKLDEFAVFTANVDNPGDWQIRCMNKLHFSYYNISFLICSLTYKHTLQLMASGQCGLLGVSVQCRVEQVSSPGTGSVPAPSALAVACRVWALKEKTKSASLPHVTVSLFCINSVQIKSFKIAWKVIEVLPGYSRWRCLGSVE